MRKKVLLQQIEMLIKKNDELYKDNVCLAEELEKKKALINELEQRLEEPWPCRTKKPRTADGMAKQRLMYPLCR